MSQKNQLPIVIEIEKEEAVIFDKQIRKYRSELIRPSQEIVDSICLKNADILKLIDRILIYFNSINYYSSCF